MNNKVGYCSPPQSKQFQKGKSGNPKGRPKGTSKNFVALIEKELGKKVRLNDGNKLTKQEILTKQLVNEAIQKNDLKALKLIMEATNKGDEKQVAQRFLDRLIKDNFISMDNAKTYAFNRAPFYCDVSSKTLTGLSKEAIAKQEAAFDAVRFNEILAYLYNQHEICSSALFMLEIVRKEFDFWESAEDTFEALRTDKKEQLSAISRLEKTREYARPPSEIYGIAFCLHQKCCHDFENAFLAVRDMLKGTQYYKDFEHRSFSDEAKQGILAEAQASQSAPPLDKLATCLERFKANYQTFMGLGTNDFPDGDITREDVLKLFDWIDTKPKR